jgi:pimeloyl-ACP methyl ester carboxylesterase
VTSLVRFAVFGAALVGAVSLSAQVAPGGPSTSAPLARFISVEPNVKLEVLDWGGTGRSMILLAGLGNTAHVFDDLARQLRADYHVYGITRRGFGKSSVPSGSYEADRLGDDVLAVMDSLRLTKPVLVGHSIAGEELSSVGSRHGNRVAALVYLDAADAYAFYDTTGGDLRLDLADLQRQLNALQAAPTHRLVNDLLESTLPRFERVLRELRDFDAGTPPPAPPPATPEDRASFAAFRAFRQRTTGFSPPIPELREQFEEMPDGRVGPPIQSLENTRLATRGILQGQQKYLRVSAPVLALFARPPLLATFPTAAAKAAAVARDSAYRARQAEVVRRAAPIARTAEIPGALHYVFLTNEADVVREINAFVKALPDR